MIALDYNLYQFTDIMLKASRTYFAKKNTDIANSEHVAYASKAK